MLDIDPRAKALIFDVDGTVADTMPMHYQAWVDVLAEYGINYSKEMFYEFAGIPTFNIIPMISERLGVAFDAHEVTEKKEKLFLKNITKVQPIEQAVNIIYKYHGKMPMSMGTGSRRTVAEPTVKAVGLDKYIDILVCPDDVVSPKPAPDTFLKCAELMGVDPKDCQVFEDGEPGLIAAKSAGMIVTDIRPFLMN